MAGSCWAAGANKKPADVGGLLRGKIGGKFSPDPRADTPPESDGFVASKCAS